MFYSLVVIMITAGYPVDIDKYTFDNVDSCERAITNANLAGVVKVSGAMPTDIKVSAMPVIAMFCVPKR